MSVSYAATSSLAGNFTAPSQQPSDLPEASFPLRMQYGEPDPDVFLQLMPCIVWAIAFLLLRVVCQRGLAWLGLYLQVVVPKTSCGSDGSKATYLSKGQRGKLKKFQSQLWLSAFYTASTVFGYIVQRDKPWFGLPLRETHRVNILVPHPYIPGPELLHYYRYGLGFYLSESVALLMEHDMKRSDFLEYVIHHIVTIALIVNSHCNHEHRVGAYVLFIHDISDIMLAVSKSINYVVSEDTKRRQKAARLKGKGAAATAAAPCLLYRLVFNETVVTGCFVAFVVLFVFFRLVCLPSVSLATVVLSMRVREFSMNFWFMAFLLHVVLQGLHVYWFALIVKVAIQIFTGGPRADIRSDDEIEDTVLTCVDVEVKEL